MKNPADLAIRLPALRYHAQDSDNLFQPIAFGFVTERMRDEILAEREHILSLLPESQRARQHRLFARYDPQHRAAAFQSLLRPFLPEADIGHRA